MASGRNTIMDYRRYIPLCIIIAIGSALRLYSVGFQCLWTEEGYTAGMLQGSWSNIVSSAFGYDFNIPLFHLVSKAILLLAGTGDLTARYISVVFGILLIPAMYFLGREYRDHAAGICAAGITAVLYPLVYYSQFGRAYAMAYFFFAIAATFYAKMKNGNNHADVVSAFFVSAALCVWTHIFMIIPVGLMMLDILFAGRTMRGLLAITAKDIAAIIITIPIAVILISVISNRTASSGFSYGMTLQELPFMMSWEFFGSLFPFMLPVTVLGALVDKSPLRNRFVTIAVVTVAAGIAASVVTPYFPRYSMAAALIAILLLASLASKIYEGLKIPAVAKQVVFWFIIALMLAMQYWDFVGQYTIQKMVC